MPAFDRATPWAGTSLARIVFRRQFTELNDQYWGPLPTELLARRFARENGVSSELTAALGVSDGNWHRVGHSVEDFQKKFAVSRSWARLLTLVLLTSSTELFFRNISRAAQLSDPALVPGFPKPLDGLALLKNGVDIELHDERFTQGAWTQRVAAYNRVFASTPDVLERSIGELDKMRGMRNRVAHEFALDAARHPYSYLSDASSASLSEKRLQSWMGVVDEVVRAVDEHLCREFVGDFETLELRHLWERGRKELLNVTGIELTKKAQMSARPFMKFLAQATGLSTNAGAAYWHELDRFYLET